MPLPLLRDTTYIITCSSRTGSTMLVHLLRSHPDIMSYGEIYSLPTPRGFAGRYATLAADPEYLARMQTERDADHVRFLYKIAFDSQDRKIAGFKFKYGQLDNPVFAAVSEQIIRDTDIKVIHLIRRNLLARYLSQYVVNNVTGFTMRVNEDEVPEVPPVTLDPTTCKRDFDKALQQQEKYGALFASHPVFPLYYEDLLEETSKNNVTRQLLGFLDVPEAPLTSTTRKLAQKPLSEAIANYARLRDFFADSVHAHLFDSPET